MLKNRYINDKLAMAPIENDRKFPKGTFQQRKGHTLAAAGSSFRSLAVPARPWLVPYQLDLVG